MRKEDWPVPGADALAHSRRLIAHIRERMAAAGGEISFEDYMDLALYAPGLGYYSAGARKFGAAGDFVTAPEASPLFARCLARQCAEVFAELGGGDILELGAGSGAMAADILAELELLGALPARYRILEISGELRARQREMLEKKLPHLLERVEWLDAPETFSGVLLANEVLDALPVARFRLDDGSFSEQSVAWDDGRFISRWRPAPENFAAELRVMLADLEPLQTSYVSERCRRLPAFIRTLAETMQSGLALYVDYGYPRREYYLPERRDGTLMCHYRHRAHADPFAYPGLQDITAFVDFTAVAEAGVTSGLELMGFTSQAQFLLGGGLVDVLPAIEPGDTLRSLQLSQEVQKLTLPGEMGDRFKVMGLSRNLERVVSGFSLKDISATL